MLDRLRRPDPVLFMIVALMCAAALVVYLQHRALDALDRQTSVILQKVAEQTVTAASQELRRAFDGPVFETLASLNHPSLVANRLDLVAKEYAHGLEANPQVERFFVWRGTQEAARPEEVLFYGGNDPRLHSPETVADAHTLFRTDPAMGKLVLDTTRRDARSQRIYSSISQEVGGVPYEVFLRVLYTDAARDHFFAILGFVVNLRDVRANLFPRLVSTRLRHLLNPADGSPRFDLRVLDETGRVVYGSASAPKDVSATAPFAMQFYPGDEIRARMATDAPPRQWQLAVSPRTHTASVLLASTRTQSYWLSGLSVLLMLAGLGSALQVRARASQLARMQSDFVAHVSHQLKTPVSLLSAVSETIALNRVRSPEKLAQCVDIVRVETARLSSLVERILEFSRVSDSAHRFEIEAVGLGPLVRETTESFAGALEASGFRIEVEETGSPATVAADPVALEQAIVNLLDNAVKYSGDSRLITVRVGTSGSDATVEVIDHGIGIESAERERIFERFYRGGGAALHRQGFGLGLAIARELVAGQRGSLDVSSTRGTGSTFRIRIPILHNADALHTSPRAARRWLRAASRRTAPVNPQPKETG